MNVRAILCCLVLLVAGCGQKTPPATDTPATPGSTPPAQEQARYPELQLYDVYETVMTAMLDSMFEDQPELSQQHRVALLAYIKGVHPFQKFEEEMVRNFETLKQGHENEALRKTEEYERQFRICVSVSVDIARMNVSNSVDVYMRKHVHPNELTKPLFEKSDSFDDDLIISWIDSEVEIEAFKKDPDVDVKDFEFQEGDRVFSYCSPPYSWECLFGRAGYAIFRNGKLVKNIVTMMN